MNSLIMAFYQKIFYEKKFFILFRPLLLLFRVLTKVTPRDRKVWVFGSGGGLSFTGNPKYLFLYLSAKKDSAIKPAWITRNRSLAKELREKGFNAHYSFSLKGIYLTLRSGVQLFDNCSNDLGYWFAGAGLKVNLWHGLPLKKIFYDDVYDMGGKMSFFRKLVLALFRPWKFEKWDYSVTTSHIFQEKLASGFRMPKKNILITGYPRNDTLFSEFPGSLIGSSNQALNKIKSVKKESRKILAYLPTFRETGKNPLCHFDLKKMLNILKKYNAFLVIKLHPYTPTTDLSVDTDFVLFLERNIDIYPMLKHIDFLITDYSSVYLDFLILNRPVIFYPFDLEEYIQNCRGFYFDYQGFTPGPIAKDFAELLNIVGKMLSESTDPYRERREEFVEKIHTFRDGKSCERVLTALLKILDLKSSAGGGG